MKLETRSSPAGCDAYLSMDGIEDDR